MVSIKHATTTATIGETQWNEDHTVPLATQAEAEAGTIATKLMTPQRTAQAIAALGGGGSFTPAIAQVRNTDTTTDLNLNGVWQSVPMTGTTVILDTDDFAISGNGIQCLFSGRVEATAVLYLSPNSNNTRRCVITFDIGGTPIGPNVICTQARNTSMNMSAAISHIEEVTANDVIGVLSQKADGFGPINMIDGQCYLTLKRLS